MVVVEGFFDQHANAQRQHRHADLAGSEQRALAAAPPTEPIEPIEQQAGFTIEIQQALRQRAAAHLLQPVAQTIIARQLPLQTLGNQTLPAPLA
ncbi:hypothetical protein D3C72_1831550 [compost metagenome]